MGARERLVLSPDVSAQVEEAARLPQSENKVALQIVPVQLRAWVVDQNDIVCRPFYIACLELYPRGKVLHARIHTPASARPGPSDLVSFLVDYMLHPPDGEPRQRPTHVSFIDNDIVDLCSPILSRLKLQVGMLTLADGVTEYVKLFSDKLVKNQRASRGDAAEYPGLLSVSGVSVKVAHTLMKEAVSMYRTAPWQGIQESIAIEARLPAPTELSSRRKLRYYVTVLGSGGKVKGFALMAGLDSLRAKYRRSKEGAMAGLSLDGDGDDSRDGGGSTSSLSSNPSSPEATLGELLCAWCGARVGEDVEGDGCRYVNRCGACKRLLYCDDRCQQIDWGTRHRTECAAAKNDKDYIFHREEWGWLRRELALLFVDPTSVPFDDLDAGEAHEWPVVADESPPLHPMAFVTTESSAGAHARKVGRPSLDELRVIILLATALAHCTAPPPKEGEMLLPNGVVLRVAEDLSGGGSCGNPSGAEAC